MTAAAASGTSRRRITRGSVTWLPALAVASAHAAHANPVAPLNYFLHAAGPAARPTLYLGWVFTAIVILVTLIVAGLLIGAMVRKRPAAQPDALSAEPGGIRWVFIGTAVSSVVLLAMLTYALITLESVASPASYPHLTITVTAYDWWWRADYSGDPNPARNFTTANEIHIPVGEPVKIQLKSADVVHAFWVPQLAGKTEAIPGQTNEQWIQADGPGIYRGQCSQFCGAQHAHMAFEVIAQDAAAFNAWRDAQGRAASVPTADAAVSAGQHLFEERCAGCHTIRGTKATGLQAPDLTHLGSRRMIAAGALSNTPDHLLDWIEHAQRIKPDALMPSIALTTREAAALSAYLATLH